MSGSSGSSHPSDHPGVHRVNAPRVSHGLFHPAGTVKVRAGSKRCDVYVPSSSGPRHTHGGGPSCESKHGPVHVPVVSPVTVSGGSVGCPSPPGIVVGALERIRPTPPTTRTIAQAIPSAPAAAVLAIRR